MDEVKSEKPSIEFLFEKDIGVYKMEISREVNVDVEKKEEECTNLGACVK